MGFKPKNREWVKNAAIVFLAVLLVLTFFSNTIMNRTLPEVATQYVTDGSVTAKVRGTGTVVANGSHQVKADADREIRSVMVREGQEVQAGDVLFVLGAGDADELDAAQEQLRQLQISYQKAAINSPTFNYTADERKLTSAEEAYNAAKAVEAEALKDLTEDSTVPTEKLDEALQNLQEAQKTYETLSLQVEADKAALKDAVDQALIEYNSLRKQFNLPEAGNVNDALLQTEPAAVVPETSPAVEPPTEPSPESAGEPPTDPEVSPATVLTAVQPKARLVLLGAGGITKLAAAEGLTELQKEQLQNARQKLSDAQMALETATFPELNAAKDYVDYCQEAYDTLLSYSGVLSDNYAKAKQDREAAEETYLSLLDALNAQKESDSKSQALAGIDMADISAQIERQKKKVEELSGGEGNQITANVSGTVESIECTAGDLKLKGDVLCTIEVPDMGYTLSFSVTNEQARRLSPGDTASVSNFYWGSQIDATLSTIRVDPQKPQTNKLLTFDVEGDVNAGSELTLSVGQRSAGYDIIVPNSSIRSDTNGQFVLAIESKSSPLGNRYIARRVDVEVLAADDINSAVTGDLGYGDYVITTSNAPVNSGDMVRMADT